MGDGRHGIGESSYQQRHETKSVAGGERSDASCVDEEELVVDGQLALQDICLQEGKIRLFCGSGKELPLDAVGCARLDRRSHDRSSPDGEYRVVPDGEEGSVLCFPYGGRFSGVDLGEPMCCTGGIGVAQTQRPFVNHGPGVGTKARYIVRLIEQDAGRPQYDMGSVVGIELQCDFDAPFRESVGREKTTDILFDLGRIESEVATRERFAGATKDLCVIPEKEGAMAFRADALVEAASSFEPLLRPVFFDRCAVE